MQLHTGALACDEHTADNTRLCPYFSALANDETFRRRPTVQSVVVIIWLSVVVARVSLQYVDGTLARHEPVLILPRNARTGADLVSYSCEPVAEVY